MTDTNTQPWPGMPAWAKLQGVVLAVFVLVVLGMAVIGPVAGLFGIEHGAPVPPGRH